ncbi:unnamed protein product [Brassica napus]|uniref:(rape) hypothetical protein n=1 Tax=Brassica napus TaxID=3708 RepID=A0A816VR29_BRANA|nr:unnamed protein product [Brassica napus]
MESYSTTWIDGHEISSILRQVSSCIVIQQSHTICCRPHTVCPRLGSQQRHRNYSSCSPFSHFPKRRLDRGHPESPRFTVYRC